MIDPPGLTDVEGIGADDVLAEVGDEDVGVELGLLLLLLHAAAVETASTAAPARQAVRTDFCRNLTAFTYS